MDILLFLLLMAALGGCGYLGFRWWQEWSAARKRDAEAIAFRAAAEKHNRALEESIKQVQTDNARLKRWEVVADADEKAEQLRRHGQALLAQAEADARVLTENAGQHYERTIEQAKQQAKALTEDARAALNAATDQSRRTIADAERRAEEIAGKAYEVVRNLEHYERAVRAMKNIIEGYGDEYLKPASSLLDDLAEEFGHKDAGRQLKMARDHTKALIKGRQAASCDYVEQNRREAAEHFVIDAFNGKVDSILSRVKHDNLGTLEQEIKDAYSIVNLGGQPFRSARINPSYLEARIAELRWAVIAQELKRQEQEEQRLIREQIREEEKALREYAKAMKEAEKEEEALRKAMVAARAQVAAATEEERALYEAQLAILNQKLVEAEERNRRAISMAQQTRRGHVYIISNVGSFGEGVYKIGLTRRLEPLDRVKELGDASVPFDFDVHAVIWSEDAPALETVLHKHFVMSQMNKVNHRKEFFRANLNEIRGEIDQMGIEAKWTMAAEAQQYRETLAIEKAIAEDPMAREAWLNRQLMLDPVEVLEASESED